MQSLAALALVALCPLSWAGDRRPDVLVIVGDDISEFEIDQLPTPNLDFLASQGVRFRRAYTSPVCSPTRYSLMFGKWHGQTSGSACSTNANAAPPLELFSLPKMLAGAGYRTGAFGKWHLGSNRLGPWEVSPNLHGFSTWRAGQPMNVRFCGGSSYSNWIRVDDGFSRSTAVYNTTAIRDAFLDWWQTSAGSAPRFGYVAFQAPHGPFHLPPAGILPAGYPVPANPTPRELYECMLVSLDFVIGEILNTVSLSDTLVVFLGDNGTPTQVPPPGHSGSKLKGTTFEGGVNVPFVVAGPGIPAGVETDALVHAVDLMATIGDYLDLRPPGSRLDSVSQLPVLLGRAETMRDYVYCDVGAPGSPGRDQAIVTHRWKLRRAGGVEALYDLLHDPGEETPIDPDERPELAAALRHLLDSL